MIFHPKVPAVGRRLPSDAMIIRCRDLKVRQIIRSELSCSKWCRRRRYHAGSVAMYCRRVGYVVGLGFSEGLLVFVSMGDCRHLVPYLSKFYAMTFVHSFVWAPVTSVWRGHVARLMI